jgi:Ion channel
MKSLTSLTVPRLFGGRFLLLFVLLLSLLLLEPFAGNAGTLYVTIRVVGLVITVLSVYAISVRRTVLLIAIAMAIPAALHRGVLPKQDASLLGLVLLGLTFAFDVFVVVSIFARVFKAPRVTSETVLGALCVYLLLGFAFGNLYFMLSRIQPNAFYLAPLLNVHAVADNNDLVYYSFATLTSLGSNGINPVTGQARSLSVIESILGVLYLAVLVAKLVGSYRSEFDV